MSSLDNQKKIESLQEADYTDGMMVAYAILELADTLRTGFTGTAHSPGPVEAIAMALGYKEAGSNGLTDALNSIAIAIDGLSPIESEIDS